MLNSTRIKIITLIVAVILVFLAVLVKTHVLTMTPKGSLKKFTIVSNVERFLPYIDDYNATHVKKAVFLYKSDPMSEIDKSNVAPDIIIAPWMRNDKTKSYFRNLNNVFGESSLATVFSKLFYNNIAGAGKIDDDQYLLPVSFNVPVIIFSKENEHFITDAIGNRLSITIDEIRKIAKSCGGFSPQSSDDFLYFYTKILGTGYKESNYTRQNVASSEMPFLYDKDKLQSAIDKIIDWEVDNGGVGMARQYVYKYLLKPDDKKVTSGHALFAFTTSDKLFCYTKEQQNKIGYRYIAYDDSIPVEDSIVMIGLPKGSYNYKSALNFLEWFFNTSTQESLLRNFNALNLDIKTFGIAGGFSAIKEVNEKVLPQYYKTLQIPPLLRKDDDEAITIYEQKPYNYQDLKVSVIIPYIKDRLVGGDCKPMESRYKDWLIINGK